MCVHLYMYICTLINITLIISIGHKAISAKNSADADPAKYIKPLYSCAFFSPINYQKNIAIEYIHLYICKYVYTYIHRSC
jgi:hypothetical protein